VVLLTTQCKQHSGIANIPVRVDRLLIGKARRDSTESLGDRETCNFLCHLVFHLLSAFI
jgi:hypothetical protein